MRKEASDVRTAPTARQRQDYVLRMVVYLAMLTALEIVLSRFLSFNAWNVKIGFSFVPVAAAAILFGPLAGAGVAAVGDILGAWLFPIGPFYPGFTLTALLTGLTFGLLLHRKQSFWRILLAVAVVQLVLGLLLNSLWISRLYSSPYLPLLGTRIFQCAVLGPVQVLVIGALAPAIRRLPLFLRQGG